MRSITISILALALSLAACVDEEAAAQRAFSLKYCGGIPTTGCCNVGTLVSCSTAGYPVVDACIGSPKCGWNAAQKRYTCGTSGGADPSGKLPISCMTYTQDMKVPDTGWYDVTPRDGFKVDKKKPDAAKGDAAKGDSAKADMAKVDAAKADAAKADKGKPDATKADAAKPDLPGPDLGAAKCGDGKCHKLAEDCQTCPADCGHCTGCEVRTTPKCSTCACGPCVCAMDPWCCSSKWDAVCVSKCKGSCGGCKLKQLPEAGVPDGPTCGDGLCTPPKEDCQSCPADCGTCNGCQIRSSPGCATCACEACVCAQDPDCCKHGWDQLCVDRCKKSCGGCKLKPVDAAVADLGVGTDKFVTPDAPKAPDLPKPVDLPRPKDTTKPADQQQPKDTAKPADQQQPKDTAKPADQQPPKDKAKPADQQPPKDKALTDQPKTVDQVVLPDQLKSVDTTAGEQPVAVDKGPAADISSTDSGRDRSSPDNASPAGDRGTVDPPPADEGGCSCRLGDPAGPPAAWLLALFVLLRRRREHINFDEP